MASTLRAFTPVLVVGGGIGGLCSALALHRAGVHSRVVLKENDFCEGPAGAICIWGKAVKVLDRLGLGSRFRTIAMPIMSGEICSISGRKLGDLLPDNRHVADGAGSDLWVVSRAEMRQCLSDALPPHCVFFNASLIDYEANPFTNKVSAKLEVTPWHQNGENVETQTRTVETKLLLGADGAHSSIREHMTGVGLPSAKHFGCARWQSIVENTDADAFPFNFGREIWGPGKRFGAMRMSPSEVYWWAVANVGGEVEEASESVKTVLKSLFKKFPYHTTQLIDASKGLSRYEALDWPLSFSWVHKSGKVALLGDAAHAGPPNFHSGCCLAIEDAYSLAQNCMKNGLTPKALYEYQWERRPQALQAILHARARWRVAQLEHPFACWLRDELLKRTGSGRRYKLLTSLWKD